MKPMLRVRQEASSASDILETSRSPIQTSPSLGRSRPAMRLRSVVLPDPDGPMMPRNSPLETSRLRFLSTSICSSPRLKYLCTPQIRMIGCSAIVAPYILLGQFGNLVKRRWIEHGNVGQDLAVQLDVGQLQTVDQLAVAQAAHPASRVDAGDPQPPEFALFDAPIPERINAAADQRHQRL